MPSKQVEDAYNAYPEGFRRRMKVADPPANEGPVVGVTMEHLNRVIAENCEARQMLRDVLMMLVSRPDMTRLMGPAEEAIFEVAREFVNGKEDS